MIRPSMKLNFSSDGTHQALNTERHKNVKLLSSLLLHSPVLPVDLTSLPVDSLEMEIVLSHAFAAAASYALPLSGTCVSSSDNGKVDNEATDSGIREGGQGSNTLYHYHHTSSPSSSDALVVLLFKVRKFGIASSSTPKPSSTVMVHQSAPPASWNRHDTDCFFRSVDRCQQRIFPPLDSLQYVEHAPMILEDLSPGSVTLVDDMEFFPSPCSGSFSTSSLETHHPLTFKDKKELIDSVSPGREVTFTLVVFFLRPSFTKIHGWSVLEESEKRVIPCPTPWWPLRSPLVPTQPGTSSCLSRPSPLLIARENNPTHPSRTFRYRYHTVEGELPWFSVNCRRKRCAGVQSNSSSLPLWEQSPSLLHTEAELWQLAKEASKVYQDRQSKRGSTPSPSGGNGDGGETDGDASAKGRHSLCSFNSNPSAAGSCSHASENSAPSEELKSQQRNVSQKEQDGRGGGKLGQSIVEDSSRRNRKNTGGNNNNSGGSLKKDVKNGNDDEESSNCTCGSITGVGGRVVPPVNAPSSCSGSQTMKSTSKEYCEKVHTPKKKGEGSSSSFNLLENPLIGGGFAVSAMEEFHLAASRNFLFLFRWRVARWIAERLVNESQWSMKEKRLTLSSSAGGAGPVGVSTGRRDMQAGRRGNAPPPSPHHSRAALAAMVGGAPRYASVLEAALGQPGRRCRHCDGRGMECTLYWVGKTQRYAYLAVLTAENDEGEGEKEKQRTKQENEEETAATSASPLTFMSRRGEAPGKKSTAIVVARVPIPLISKSHEAGSLLIGDENNEGLLHSPSFPSTSLTEKGVPSRKRIHRAASSSPPLSISSSLGISLEALDDILGYDKGFVFFPFSQWRVVIVRAHAVVVVALSNSGPFSTNTRRSPANSSASNFSSIKGSKTTLRCVLEDCFVTSLCGTSSSLLDDSPAVINFNDLKLLIEASCKRYLKTSTQYASLLSPKEQRKREENLLKNETQVEREEGQEKVVTEGEVEALSACVPCSKDVSTLSDPRKHHLPFPQQESSLCERQVEILTHGLQLLEAMRDTCSVHFKKRRGKDLEEEVEVRPLGRTHVEAKVKGTGGTLTSPTDYTVMGDVRWETALDGEGPVICGGPPPPRPESLVALPSPISPRVSTCASKISPLCTRIPVIRTCRDVTNILEGPTVEFKYSLGDERNLTSTTATVDRLRHTIAAMASTLGGVVCIGVRDEDGVVVGHPMREVQEKNEKRLTSGYCPAMVKDAVTLQELPVLLGANPPIKGTHPGASGGVVMGGFTSSAVESVCSHPCAGWKDEQEERKIPADTLETGNASSASPSGITEVFLAKDWWKTGRMLRSTAPSSSSVEERRMTVLRIQRGQAPFYSVAKGTMPYQRGCASTTPMSIWTVIHRMLQHLKD